MTGFKEFSLDWKGKTHVIPPHKVLGAIARVEEVLTLPELQQYAARGSPPIAKIAMAYARLLRYAGVNVSDVEMYHGMFGVGESVEPQSVLTAMTTLVAMMIPPEALKVAQKQKDAPPGNDQLPRRKKNMSKRRTS